MSKQSFQQTLNRWTSIIGSGSTLPSFSGSSLSNFNAIPMSMQIAARTIGLDLVAVKPMASPISSIHWMDFVYETAIERKQKIRRQKLKKLNKLFRADKLKYITEVLSKNN